MTRVLAARDAVAAAFVLNGLCFATWVSRIPDARSRFELSNSGLGLLLLVIAVGSLVALPLTGAAIGRWGTVRVVRVGVSGAAGGLVVAAAGLGLDAADGSPLVVTAVGLLAFGLGIGVWDVAMNVEGAEVERHLTRTVMPRFHAGFSLGAAAGAGVGAGAVALHVPAWAHLGVVAATSGLVVSLGASRFLPVEEPSDAGGVPSPPARSAWLEPRTLAIGVLVLALAMTEGTANDWLAVALVDGHGVDHATGVAGFGLFVAAMSAGRWFGTDLVDRWGRAAALWTTIALAALGVGLVVLATSAWLAGVGVLLWGVGTSLGFPLGMSAAADDPARAAARVSVVSTIGYGAFLAGPPLLGFLGDAVGTLPALLVVVAVLAPAALAVPAARRA